MAQSWSDSVLARPREDARRPAPTAYRDGAGVRQCVRERIGGRTASLSWVEFEG